MNKAEATKLTGQIKANIAELDSLIQRFIDMQGWLAMDYRSFTSWWDAEIGQLRLGGAIKNVVLSLMVLEQSGLVLPIWKPGTLTSAQVAQVRAMLERNWNQHEVSEALSIPHHVVNRIAHGGYVPAEDRIRSDKDIAGMVGVSRQLVGRLRRQPPGHRREVYTTHIGADVSPDDAKELTLVCKRKAMTKADALRIAVHEWLARQDTKLRI
jgi:hypothetical protein